MALLTSLRSSSQAATAIIPENGSVDSRHRCHIQTRILSHISRL